MMKFGILMFLGLLKPNLKLNLLNSQPGAAQPQGWEGKTSGTFFPLFPRGKTEKGVKTIVFPPFSPHFEGKTYLNLSEAHPTIYNPKSRLQGTIYMYIYVFTISAFNQHKTHKNVSSV